MFKKTIITIVCFMGLVGCGTIATQTIQTTHIDFSIPTYRQADGSGQRQDTRINNTGSIILEYAIITDEKNFDNLIQANINTLRQNMSTQLDGDIVTTDISIACSGDVITGNIISFQIQQGDDVLYFSQIFTIYKKDVTIVSIESATDSTRNQTVELINKSMLCRKI